jgi:hypothetical protein
VKIFFVDFKGDYMYAVMDIEYLQN